MILTWKKGVDPAPQRAELLEIRRVCAAGDLKRFTELFVRGEWYISQVKEFLTTATIRDHAPIVRFLLEKGDPANDTPVAIFREHMKGANSMAVLEAYIERGWDVNKPDRNGHLILPFSASDERYLRWLLDHGADPNLGSEPGAMARFRIPQSPSHTIRSAQEEAARIDYLTAELIKDAPDSEKNRIRHNITSRMDPTNILHFQREGVDLVVIFFRNKAAARVKEERPPAPLPHYQKLENEAGPPFAESGDTLNNTSDMGTISAINLLVERGAKLENCLGLHAAAAQGIAEDAERIPMLNHLLALGLDINGYDEVKGFYGTGTPLHSAVLSLQIHKARFLLEKGADPDKKNCWGMTPLDMLRGREHIYPDLTELLKKYSNSMLEGVEEISNCVEKTTVSN